MIENQFSGQTKDEPTKDVLIAMGAQQIDPYRARGGDFPVKAVDAKTGQSGAHGTAEGMDKLAEYTENQCGPRYAEDGGPGSSGAGTPTEWNSGGRSARVASSFPIETNKGESSSMATTPSLAESLNLQTGMIEVKGYSPTKMKETGESKVTIGRR